MSKVLPAPALIFLDSRLALLPGKLRSKPVESLRLTTKVVRSLSAAGINSVGDLVHDAAQGLQARRGLGASAIDEICLALEKLARRTGGKNKDFEARYSASGRGVFFFRAPRLKEMSYRQLNNPVEVLGVGKSALLFARKTCLAASLGRFLEKCAEGVRVGRAEHARQIPEICRALEALTKSVAHGGRTNWQGYRRIFGSGHIAREPVVKTVPQKKHAEPSIPVRAVTVPRYPGHSHRVSFDVSKLAAMSEEAKEIRLDQLLSCRPFNLYSAIGVETLGGLVELAANGFSQPYGYGHRCYTETAALLEAAKSAIDSQGHINQTRLFEILGRPFVIHAAPKNVESNERPGWIRFPILRYTSENLERLSDQARSQLLHNLHLDSRAATTMEKHGVRDVGTFVDKLKEGINANRLRNFGRRAFNELAESITSLSSSIDAKGDCDWMAYASARGFKVLPFGEIREPSEALKTLSEVVVLAVEAQFGGVKDFSRHMEIFKGRLHSPLGRHMTLEQLAHRYRLSRERIRQNEMQISAYLSAAMLESCYSVPVKSTYEGLRFRFRPAVESTLQSANAALNAEGRKVWRLDDWVRFLSQLWNTDPQLVESNALLLSVLFRFSLEAQTVDGETKGFLLVSEDVPTALKQDLRDLLKDIQFSMQGSLEPLSSAEVIEPFDFKHVLAALAISSDQLLSFCPALSTDNEGLWRIKPEFFRPQAAKLTRDAVYEILRLQGTRMHKADIIRIFKAKHPDLFGNERLFVARIASDARFDALNKSGFWVLSEWNKETGTIREVIDRVMNASSGPMNISDILISVRKIVPCAESSIRHHLLHSRGKYIRLSKTVFDLASRHAGEDA